MNVEDIALEIRSEGPSAEDAQCVEDYNDPKRNPGTDIKNLKLSGGNMRRIMKGRLSVGNGIRKKIPF